MQLDQFVDQFVQIYSLQYELEQRFVQVFVGLLLVTCSMAWLDYWNNYQQFNLVTRLSIVLGSITVFVLEIDVYEAGIVRCCRVNGVHERIRWINAIGMNSREKNYTILMYGLLIMTIIIGPTVRLQE